MSQQQQCIVYLGSQSQTLVMVGMIVLCACSDPTAALLKFAEERGRRVEVVSLGQGQGPVAQRWIEEGVQEGFWVVLQNCHLAKSFLPHLELICEQQLQGDKVWLLVSPCLFFRAGTTTVAHENRYLCTSHLTFRLACCCLSSLLLSPCARIGRHSLQLVWSQAWHALLSGMQSTVHTC